MVFYGIEFGRGTDWVKDLMTGLLLGISFILLNLLSPAISIGFPSVSLAVSSFGRFFVVGIVAPIAEESVFRGSLLSILKSKFIGLNNFFAILISSVAFSGFHLVAYGDILTSSGAFVGAIIFGLLAGVVTIWRKSILPAIVLHMIFNIFLVSKSLVVISI